MPSPYSIFNPPLSYAVKSTPSGPFIAGFPHTYHPRLAIHPPYPRPAWGRVLPAARPAGSLHRIALPLYASPLAYPPLPSTSLPLPSTLSPGPHHISGRPRSPG